VTLPRVSYEARCPDCGRRVVVPKRDAECYTTYVFVCCAGRVEAMITKVEKKRPAKKVSRSTLRRRRGPKRSDLARRLSDRWAKSSRNLPCAACGAVTDLARGVIVEGHHIVRQALIRARGKEEDWEQEELDRRLWDLRNRLPLCGDCHRRHHSGMKRLAWSLVLRHATKIVQFADEIGLTARAKREYA
jgi:hypothetical protein